MKFKQYLGRICDAKGFFPTPELRWVIRKNTSPTSREEAIAAKVIEAANPRQNITGHAGWGPEEQMVLQQRWLRPENPDMELWRENWRDVPVEGAAQLYSTVETEHGPLNVPNSIKEPGVIIGDFYPGDSDAIRHHRRELMGEDF